MVLFWGSWVEKEDVVRWFSKEIKNWRERKMVCGWGSQVRELYIRFLGIKISGQCSELTQKSLPVQRLQTHRLFFFFFLLKTLTELWLTLRPRLDCIEKVSRWVFTFSVWVVVTVHQTSVFFIKIILKSVLRYYLYI